MNKINPIYILLFFISITLFMMYQSSSMQDKISEQEQKNSTILQSGKQLKVLQERWGDSQSAKRDIDKVLELKQLSKKLKSATLDDGIYTIKLDALTAREVDTLTSKLLNLSVEIESINYKRDSDKSVSVEMEFVL